MIICLFEINVARYCCEITRSFRLVLLHTNCVKNTRLSYEIYEGIEYAYTEGSFKAVVNVLENNSDEELMVFTLFVIESNREDRPPGYVFSVNATNHNFAYVGMWRLWDVKRYDEKMFLD